MKLIPTFAVVMAATLALAATAHAQLIVPTFHDYASALGGTTSDAQWSGFTLATRPSGVSTNTAGAAGQWPGGLASSNPNSSALFGPTPGNPTDTTDFIDASTGGGIYAFFSQTHFSVSNAAPLTGLESLTLQIYQAGGFSGKFGGTPVDLVTAPTLNLTTDLGTFSLAATFSQSESSYPLVVNGFTTTLDTLSYQWDLSGVSGEIESYSIDWQTSYHSITYGADLTESTAQNSNSVLVVPEPFTWSLIVPALGLLLWRSRRRNVA